MDWRSAKPHKMNERSAKGHLGESFDEHIILRSFISQHEAKLVARFALIFRTKKKRTAETLDSYKFQTLDNQIDRQKSSKLGSDGISEI